MAFPVFSGLASIYEESTEKFYLWTSLDFEKRIAYCLIKRYCFQARNEVNNVIKRIMKDIMLLKEFCHFPELVSINLWVTCETEKSQPGR